MTKNRKHEKVSNGKIKSTKQKTSLTKPVPVSLSMLLHYALVTVCQSHDVFAWLKLDKLLTSALF